MSMTRTDFEVIAKAIREARESGAHGKAVGQIIGKVAYALKMRFQNFDRARFIRACRPVPEPQEEVAPTVATPQTMAQALGFEDPQGASFTYAGNTYRVGDRIQYRESIQDTFFGTIQSLRIDSPTRALAEISWENSDRNATLWLHDIDVSLAPRQARATVVPATQTEYRRDDGVVFRVGDSVRYERHVGMITSFGERDQVSVAWIGDTRIAGLFLDDASVYRIDTSPTAEASHVFSVGDTVRVPEGTGCCGHAEGTIIQMQGESVDVLFDCGGMHTFLLSSLSPSRSPALA